MEYLVTCLEIGGGSYELDWHLGCEVKSVSDRRRRCGEEHVGRAGWGRAVRWGARITRGR
jgi:hypothetical protein